MSTPKVKAVQVKDFDTYKCICEDGLLFREGCQCGAMQAAKNDAAAAQRRLEYDEWVERRQLRDFLIKPPTPPITFKTGLCVCGHEAADHQTTGHQWQGFCDEEGCDCKAWRPT